MLAKSFWALPLSASALLGALAGVVYLVGCIKGRRGEFTAIDALITVLIMAVVTAVAMPLLSKADDQAKSTALAENLRILREKIELYKLEHGSQVPLVYKGALPQLTESTNAEGVPGPAGKEYPFGPYLPHGIPVNPYSGSSCVELTEAFPPTKQGAAGGWLYHQATGRIAADHESSLDQERTTAP
ncbi:MAG: hypothetical protein ABFD16_15690 [Thermoguttaceae bacterium]